MDFWMNMLDSEPMKISRVRDLIEKASNSKIKSRKKINEDTMTHEDETITNLESLLDNFQREKEISESNDKEYSQKQRKINSLT